MRKTRPRRKLLCRRTVALASAALAGGIGLAAGLLGCVPTTALHRQSLPDRYTFPQSVAPVFVRFDDNNGHWDATVEDSRAVFGRQGKTWGPSAGLCSEGQFVSAFNDSLTRFRSERPGAHLSSVVVRMHVVKGLWGAILTGVRRELARTPGRVGDANDQVYFRCERRVNSVLRRSPEVASISRAMKRQGLTVTGVAMVTFLAFRPSPPGQRWSDVAALPDAGLEVPGLIEFDVSEGKPSRK